MAGGGDPRLVGACDCPQGSFAECAGSGAFFFDDRTCECVCGAGFGCTGDRCLSAGGIFSFATAVCAHGGCQCGPGAGPQPRNCGGQGKFDIVFLVDNSGSIEEKGFVPACPLAR